MSTLALNIIVGKGEAELLGRCLGSFHAPEVFDEIVVVNTSDDEEIDSVASELKLTIARFQWISEDFPEGNFGGARNCAVDNTKSDYIMWLDSDDLLNPKYFEQWKKLVETVKDDKNNKIELFTMPYALICDTNGDPVSAFTRERIFKRTAARWRNPVHELILPIDTESWKTELTANFNGVSIVHAPIKPQYTSAVRNIKILEHEYFVKKVDDIHIKFFLARDYLIAGRIKESEELFNDIIDKMETSYDMLYAIAIEMVWYYAYGKYHPRPQLKELNIKNEKQLEKWLRIALAFSAKSAEPFVLLGDLYFIRDNFTQAERLYMLAMSRGKDVPKVQNLLFYKEIPLWRLSMLYYHTKEYEKSRCTIKKWIPVSSNPEQGLHIRKEVFAVLGQEYGYLKEVA